MQSLQNIYIPIQSFLSENISFISIKSLSVESFPIVAPITITTTLTILVSEVTLRLFSALKYSNKVSQGASLLAGIATIVILSPTLPIGLGSGFLFMVYKVYCLSKKPAVPLAPPPPLAAVSEPDVKQQLAQPRIAELETEMQQVRLAHQTELQSLQAELKTAHAQIQALQEREKEFNTAKEALEKQVRGANALAKLYRVGQEKPRKDLQVKVRGLEPSALWEKEISRIEKLFNRQKEEMEKKMQEIIKESASKTSQIAKLTKELIEKDQEIKRLQDLLDMEINEVQKLRENFEKLKEELEPNRLQAFSTILYPQEEPPPVVGSFSCRTQNFQDN